MKLLDWTCPTPEENLACDEALLEFCENGRSGEVLRFWEPQQHFVVLGYSCHARSETYFDFCQQNNIPVLRRISGGGTVLQGPGCLNFSLVLLIEGSEYFTSITRTNNRILNIHKEALEPLIGQKIEIQGHTDLTTEGLKFSGNAQRRGRKAILFHGTILLDLDLSLMEKALVMPSRKPIYRRDRAHKDFLRQLNIPSNAIKEVLKKSWNVAAEYPSFPVVEEVKRLVLQKYSQDPWNLQY